MTSTTSERSLFEYTDYRAYLKAALPTQGESRGIRSKLAAHLRCQNAFVSRVIAGLADFSLEHAIQISKFLEHTPIEADYFLLLVQHAKAGSKDLKDHYQAKIREIREKRQQVGERIQVKRELSSVDQMTYYSAWYYSAIHILLMIPPYQTRTEIAQYLQLPPMLVSQCLEFLVSTGLAVHEDGKYRAGQTRIHLSRESPMISKHHANWRMRAVNALDRASKEDLFFSGPVCVSEQDARKLKEMMLDFLAQMEKVIRPSPEEALFCIGMDFFRV